MHTEHAPSNPEVQYEKTDAHPRPLYHFLFWICVTTIFSAIFSWGVFGWLTKWRAESSQPAVMALPQDGPDAPKPPAPRLDAREAVTLAEFKKEEAEILSTYGIVDKDKGVFHMPIDEAMKLALERGFPVAGDPATPEAKATASPKAATAKPAAATKTGATERPKAARK